MPKVPSTILFYHQIMMSPKHFGVIKAVSHDKQYATTTSLCDPPSGLCLYWSKRRIGCIANTAQ